MQSKRCDACQRPMRALFTSCVCDYCDGVVDVEYHHGYVVFRGSRDFDGRPVYVFRTRTDAAVWRAANELNACPILEVLSESPFIWRESAGTIENIVLADRPYELYPNRRFAPAANRAFLADEFPRSVAA